LPYKVIIKKCEETQRAEKIAGEIARWSGVAKDKVLNVLIKKSLCIRMKTEEKEALELKNKFEAVGATVQSIECSTTDSPSSRGQSEAEADKKEKKVSHKEDLARQLEQRKTDIVIVRKKNDDKEKAAGLTIGAGESGGSKKQARLIKKQSKRKSIPEDTKDQDLSETLLTEKYRNEYIKELFRSLRTKILMGLHDFTDKSIVVTSLEASTGKSTMASNIAISVAQQNMKTILIDGDMRRGLLNKSFKLEQSPGLSDVLISANDISKEYISTILKPTHVTDLFLIPSGPYVNNSSELLTSKKFLHLKKTLSEMFQILIVDTPPLGAVTDAVVVNEMFSRYIIIVKAGVTNVVDMKKKINEYPALKEKVLGLVLNYAAVDKIRSYYKRSKYYTENKS
jgi:capsular exopolysaccharide synthesis family protein